MAAPQLFLDADPGVCGDDLVLEIEVLDDAGVPVDTSSIDAAQFRYEAERSGLRGTLRTLGNGVEVSDAAGGVYRCTVPAEESATYVPGWHRFHLRLFRAGRPVTGGYGRRQLLPSVV